MLPFTRWHQEGQARQLVRALDLERAPVVHLARFPHITINHALVIFDYADAEDEIRFSAYDPNHSDGARILRFDRASRTFFFPRTDYFAGGRVDVYQIYHAFPYRAPRRDRRDAPRRQGWRRMRCQGPGAKPASPGSRCRLQSARSWARPWEPTHSSACSIHSR